MEIFVNKRRSKPRRIDDVNIQVAGKQLADSSSQTTKEEIFEPQPQIAKAEDTLEVHAEQIANETISTEQANMARDSEPTSSPSSTPIDMGLPGGPSQLNDAEPIIKIKRRAKIKKIAFKITGVLIILVLVGGGYLAYSGYRKINGAFKGGAGSAVSLKTDVDPNLLKGEGDGRINILLMGRGGGYHVAPDLTDTMILASVDPINKTATLISIPRDLWVKIPNLGAMKINAAWQSGAFKYLGGVEVGSTNPKAIQAGFDLVDQTITSVFGVPINYNVLVNFQAFKQAVDAVNGISVNVPEDLYDPTMAWENNNNPYLARAGVQNFDGKQALIYVRSRETTSDFARSLRQRTVMLSIKDKIKSLGTLSNPLKISGLVSAFGDNVATDLTIQDASRLYGIVKDISDANITSVGLADPPNRFITTGPMNGQSIGLPTAGLFNYADIQTFVRSQLKDGHIIKENAKIQVLNGTTSIDVAIRVTEALKSYGYNVVSTGVTPTSGYVKTQIINLSRSDEPYTKNYLEKRFRVVTTTRLPDILINANGADFVIIVGEDEITTPKI